MRAKGHLLTSNIPAHCVAARLFEFSEKGLEKDYGLDNYATFFDGKLISVSRSSRHGIK